MVVKRVKQDDNREKTLYNYECKKVNHKILVVEDSKFFNNAVTKEFTSDGHIVTQAYTLEEANQFIESMEFDFILLDLILPDGEGDEIIDAMPKKLRSKVIVLSGDEDSQRRDYIFKAGVLDYFSKSNAFHMIIDDIKNLMCTVEQNSLINILIVDDSSFMRKTLKGVLSPKRFNIFEARGAKIGLDILKNMEIHLVLLDYEMPDMNGAQMLEKIKKNRNFLDLPVIMLSGSDNKDIIARVLKHGASDFIKKPYATEELLLKCDLHVKDYINVKKIKQKEQELEISLQRAKDAEHFKSMFLANMSHEIRTPLNAIMGFVELLSEEEKDERKLDYLTTIQGSGKLLLNLINDILDFSKIESNKLDINKEVFIIYELYEMIISLYTPMVNEKNLNFKTIIDPNLPKYLNSDFLRIKQIVTNLLGNAIKFTPENGDITFEISLKEDKKFVEFSINDTGIGIDPKNHKKVFELFSQAEETTTKKFGGTGLGLSISAKLVTLLGGEIGIQSELGQGSRFYFTIPIDEIDKTKIIHHERDRAINNTIKLDHHILLVEDNKANQKFMSIMLDSLDLTFDIANDGLEAVENFKVSRYDAILMDENMPNMNGIEATKQILEYEKVNNLTHTPIIALTANALKGDRERFLSAGMDEYLTKPLSKIELSEVLENFLLKHKEEIWMSYRINLQEIADELGFDLEDVEMLMEVFLESAKDNLQELKIAVDTNDMKSIFASAHAIKGSAANLTLNEISTIANEMEHNAREEKDMNYKESYKKLQLFIDNIEV